MLLLTAPSSSVEERTRRSQIRSLFLQKSPSSTSMGKEKFPTNVRPTTADVQEEEQSGFTRRTIKLKKHLWGPIVRKEASPERGLPQLEDSSIIPTKGSDMNATSSAIFQVVQARMDAVIGGGGSKALGLGFSSRIVAFSHQLHVRATKCKKVSEPKATAHSRMKHT
jgi:hypothetical protein